MNIIRERLFSASSKLAILFACAAVCGVALPAYAGAKTAKGPELSVLPKTLNLPKETVLGSAGTSPTGTVILLNPATNSTSITINSITSSDPAVFTAAQSCVSTLQPGANCGVVVTFNPTSPGKHQAKLTIADTGSPATATVKLIGIARQGKLVYSPHAVSLGSVATGSSGTQNVTLTNPNELQMTLSAKIRSGSAFSLVASSQPCGSTLAANGGQCQLAVEFSPTKRGPQDGILEIDDDAAHSPQLVHLKGVGKKSSGGGPGAEAGLGASVAHTIQQSFGGFLSLNPSEISNLLEAGSRPSTPPAERIKDEQAAMAKGEILTHALAIARIAAQQISPITTPCSVSGSITITPGTGMLSIDFSSCVEQVTNTDGSTYTGTSNGTLTFIGGTPQTCGTLSVENFTLDFGQSFSVEAVVASAGGQTESDVSTVLTGFSITFSPTIQSSTCTLSGFELTANGTAAATDHLDSANDTTVTMSDFTVTLAFNGPNGVNGLDLSFAGTLALTSSCGHATVTIATPQPFVFAAIVNAGVVTGFQTTPSSGELTVTDTSTGVVTTVTVNPDGTVTIDGQTYALNNLPKVCP